MIAAVLFGALFGLGALAVLTAQPHGAPKPSLASRLAALRPESDAEMPKARERVFRTDVFEEVLRPAIERRLSSSQFSSQLAFEALQLHLRTNASFLVSGGGRNRTHQRPFDRSPVLKSP